MGDDGIFDHKVAATYDDIHTGGPVLEAMVDCLASLSTDRTALEFAIGTGRVAIPLKARGIDVFGIELSQAMVGQLHCKDPDMQAVVGDMTTTMIDRTVSIVFLVYNTIDNLTTQDAQVACFQNAARHLVTGGRFVVETLVPQIQRLPFGETLLAHACNEDRWGIDEIDIATQTYSSHHVRFDDAGGKRFSVPFRYAWPAEMDLMARIAGLELEHRWSDWNQANFDRHSTRHISVWRKA